MRLEDLRSENSGSDLYRQYLMRALAGTYKYLPLLEGHPETGMPPMAPGQPPMEQFPRGPFDPAISPLTPVPRPPLRKDLSLQELIKLAQGG
jgi:hypothetical protein